MLDTIFNHKFSDGFECAIDLTGIIWIKYADGNFERPCMKCCYDVIKTRSLVIAKYVLAKSCEIQNSKEISDRALLYRE